MSSSAGTKILVGIAIFSVISILQVPWVRRSALSIEDFNQVAEVTGPFGYINYGRERSATWIGNMDFWCSADPGGRGSCLTYMSPVPKGSVLTVRFAKINQGSKQIALAINIKMEDRELLSRTPEEYIKIWNNGNYYWLFVRSFMFALVVVMFWAIFSSM